MWRVILSIAAVVLNVIVLAAVAIGGLGVAAAQGDAPLSGAQIVGFVFVVFAGVTALTSIVAVAVGARLRGRTPPNAVASEFR
jgi:arginine exporter protein ArgO